MSNYGDIDGEALRIKLNKKDYPNLVRVDEPIMTVEQFVILKKTNKIDIKNWDDLLPYRTGIVSGVILHEHNLMSLPIRLSLFLLPMKA